VNVEDCTAAEALAAFAAEAGAAVGFAYSPQQAPWFRLDADGQPRLMGAITLDLAAVFELRAFTADRELRWWNTSAGRGRCRTVADQVVCAPCGRRERGDTYERLLWGTVSNAGDGWATLFEPRIGHLPVPVDGASAGEHVWLTAVEYRAEDRYGNVAVVDERLAGLAARRPPAQDPATQGART
jgi:CRISPR-associated protein (TIGR03984 family)